ncbi:MAG: flavodoxin [Bacteroidales bacterium]|jgi:flavodoxin I|nr:flavodoxin [Bacteroidales bacterium]
MNKTILIFWPEGGNVENSAKMIAKEFGDIKILPMNKVTEDTLVQYDKFIIGGSTSGAETWEGTKNESPWNTFFTALKKQDFSNKKVALFGLGDQVLWPSNFVDGLDTIYSAFIETGAQLIGKWSTEGYDFTDSKAVEGNYFVGLALDEDQQDELSEERVSAWVKQIKEEF